MMASAEPARAPHTDPIRAHPRPEMACFVNLQVEAEGTIPKLRQQMKTYCSQAAPRS